MWAMSVRNILETAKRKKVNIDIPEYFVHSSNRTSDKNVNSLRSRTLYVLIRSHMASYALL